ncbi:long-chain acyl-CoA synthetase [Lampropedia hyalina DSM 16112]|jgi:long-chain acyl-CoA synthetase|uniref:Long-chain-fatty-acid--CoA ligase n=1 Tax=Lampropedia hyalina DSM 16112 TaxID=1122156 RepID=A0A1M5B823_9BURK|nr:AMP-binding protein [Lampropedia hyalina]SHF38598.1 long-chain acyl-CoA synthetase [Lampropedia hyalina DSM 16112]
MNTLPFAPCTTPRPWLSSYPAGMPTDIEAEAARHASLVELMESAFERHGKRTAYSFLGKRFSYADIDRLSRYFAAYLQSLGLRRGERVAVMLPNIVQYPIVAAAVLRTGLVLVNTNPLYTARELQHQLQDSGAKAIVALEQCATTLQQCLAHTAVEHIVLARIGDQLGFLQGMAANWMVRRRQKDQPSTGWHLPQAIGFNHALNLGRKCHFQPPSLAQHDLALLQYTGGTTGVSKAAMLTHGNLIANTLQSTAWNRPALQGLAADEVCTTVCALPLYHIFAFTVGLLMSLHQGGTLVLIPDPRDMTAMLRELQRHRIHIFPAVNTLFNGLLRHPDFDTVNWQHLRLCGGGGMAVQPSVAQEWLERTGCAICEGYGLTEASPSVACNLVTTRQFSGTIGLPLPGTHMQCVDERGHAVAAGVAGEIAIRGPQLMQGYWQRPQETAEAMTADGYFLTGDIGIMDEQGIFRIVDRKKDMILVSGFNVYPNEIEHVVQQLPGVRECAVVGVPDAQSGEAVKLVVVLRHDVPHALGEAALRHYLKNHLTAYKRPRHIEFRQSLPKNTVGKILRRALRDEETQG